MLNAIKVYVCATAEDAEAARQLLLGDGYDPSDIVIADQCKTFSYNAELFGGNGSTELRRNKWIVIGRK